MQQLKRADGERPFIPTGHSANQTGLTSDGAEHRARNSMCQVPVGNSKGEEECEGEERREVSSTTSATSRPDEKTSSEEQETLLEQKR